MDKAGFVLIALGIATADSECLIVPILLLLAGFGLVLTRKEVK